MRFALVLGATFLVALFGYVWLRTREPALPIEPAELFVPVPAESEVAAAPVVRDEPPPPAVPVPSEPPTTQPVAPPPTEPAQPTAEERYGQLSLDELKRTFAHVRVELSETRKRLVEARLEAGDYELEVRQSPGQTVELGQSSDPFGVQFGGRIQPLADGSVELHKVSLKPGEDLTFDRLNADYYWLNVRIRELEKSAKRD
ncbi:MAG: hypothetical protein HUU28_10985 [Planctomycetaceae bacterium]|nr:hypothetical protein [Planctomycetaceae bacterium]